MASSWNLFSIGRRPDDEDQLTEMLAWIASAVPGVRAALVELALGQAVDPSELEVTTQYSIAGVGRLDALIEGSACRVVVESKLGSQYGDDQVGRYLRWLADRSDDRRSSLLTLTAREARWPVQDIAFANAHGIAASARRWGELHDLLEPMAETNDREMSARIVREFLDMLADENLVPVKPLTGEELGTAWTDAWTTIRRYREFFRACKAAIAEALDGTASSSSSERGDWFWQDYTLQQGTRLVVGLFYTDENQRIQVHTRGPILWVSARADDRADWDEVAARLDASRPPGWSKGSAWYERPTIWRPLAGVVDRPTFEEQKAALAAAAAEGRAWVDSALAEAPSEHRA